MVRDQSDYSAIRFQSTKTADGPVVSWISSVKPCHVKSAVVYLRGHGAVVDTDIVDQAGPEGSGGRIAASADDEHAGVVHWIA